MMRMEMRIEPKGTGRQHLRWMADTICAIADLYDYLAWVVADEALDDDPNVDDDLEPSERDHLASVQAAAYPPPLAVVREGSLVLELAQQLDAIGVQIAVLLGVLIKRGPDAAALPARIKESWYSSNGRALKAKQSLDRLKAIADVDPEPDRPAQPARRQQRSAVQRQPTLRRRDG